MRTVAAELWRAVGLREATPARALEAGVRVLRERLSASSAGAVHFDSGVVIGEVPADARARVQPRPVLGDGLAIAGLWPHGELVAALFARGVTDLDAFAALAEEVEVAYALAEEAEELRRNAPSPEELAAMRQRTLQRLWHELLTPVALLRAAHEQLRLVETDEKKQRPLRRIGTAAERLGHLFDLLNDILWAREGAQTRIAATQLAESLVSLAEAQLHVELAQAGLTDDHDALRAAAMRLADHARALVPLVDEPAAPVDLQSALEGAVAAVRRSAPDRRLDLGVRASAVEQLPPQLFSDAITSLLRNAVANTPDGSAIEVVAARDRSGLTLSVVDHGVGMPRAQLEAVIAGLGEARDPAWYGTGKPYAFGAGGAGLDLQRFQTMGRWRGWALEADSKLCPHVDAEGRGCPGDTAKCPAGAACASLDKGTVVRIRFP